MDEIIFKDKLGLNSGCNAPKHINWYLCYKCEIVFCGTCKSKNHPHKLKKNRVKK